MEDINLRVQQGIQGQYVMVLKGKIYCNLMKIDFVLGPSINDVSLEGEGGGSSSEPIYYISLFSNLSRQGEGGGS